MVLVYAWVVGSPDLLSVARLAKLAKAVKRSLEPGCVDHVLAGVEQSAQTPTEFPFPPRRTWSPFYQDPLALDVFLHSAWIDHDMLRSTRVIISQPDYGSINLYRHGIPLPFLRQVFARSLDRAMSSATKYAAK